MAQEISFSSFGAIPSSNPTFHGGLGRSGSFVPIARQPVDISGNQAKINPNPEYPFAVWRKLQSGVLKYGVYYYSELRSDFLDSTSVVEITGLLGNNPTASDPNWFTASSSTKIYLQIRISSGIISSASIKHDTSYNGGVWVSGGDVEDDRATPPDIPKQIYARKLIAEINTDGTIDQKLNTNLGMINLCVNGIAAIYPIST
jgi:hypothetical protein